MNTVANTVQRSGTPRNGLATRHPLIVHIVVAYAGLLMIFTRGRLGYQRYLQQAEPHAAPRTARA
jgi:hypothetical protein